MLRRVHNLFEVYHGPAPETTLQIESEGHALLRNVFRGDELQRLREAVLEVYAEYPADARAGIPDSEQTLMYRYEMFNRSAVCQSAIAHPEILAVVEPLLGQDCHVINCTAWRNPPGEAKEPQAFYWHIDGGPYVPRREGVAWPEEIPYPIFVIATHIYLDDCTLDDGPTSVIPTSHRSGLAPPESICRNDSIEYNGHGPSRHVASAGDVSFFVSDSWHRRKLPTERSTGRFFLQTNYGRRDIAPRLLPSSEVCQANSAARQRASTLREQQLIGLHPYGFYDG